MKPVKLGEYARDDSEEEPEPIIAPEFCSALCESCFLQTVCVVSRAIREIATGAGPRIAVGSCEAHLPISKDEQPAGR